MFVFVGLALHWLKYHYHVTFALRFNANISVWMSSYLVLIINIRVEYQMLFGWLKWGIAFAWEYGHCTCFIFVCNYIYLKNYRSDNNKKANKIFQKDDNRSGKIVCFLLATSREPRVQQQVNPWQAIWYWQISTTSTEYGLLTLQILGCTNGETEPTHPSAQHHHHRYRTMSR
jgi:hypothetical protein